MKSSILIFLLLALSPWAEAQNFLLSARCKISNQQNLDALLSDTRRTLERRSRCAEHFENYFSMLLQSAEGYPGVDNKRKFSDLLVWASDAGIVTRQRAEELYNRYFSPKFLAMMGEYNLCSSVCQQEDAVVREMEQELRDKERGLLKICRDNDAFTEANRLFSDSVVVLRATCQSCQARQL